MGRIRFEPTAEQRSLVENLVAFGMTYDDIIRLVHWPIDRRRANSGKTISVDTLRDAFAEELKTGTVKANAKVAASLFNQATSGTCIAATIFWTKTRMGWRETASKVDLSVTGELLATPVPVAVTAGLESLTDEELDAYAAIREKIESAKG